MYKGYYKLLMFLIKLNITLKICKPPMLITKEIVALVKFDCMGVDWVGQTVHNPPYNALLVINA